MLRNFRTVRRKMLWIFRISDFSLSCGSHLQCTKNNPHFLVCADFFFYKNGILIHVKSFHSSTAKNSIEIHKTFPICLYQPQNF